MQRYIHLSSFEQEVVTLGDPFVRSDGFGRDETFAPIAERHGKLSCLRFVEIARMACRTPPSVDAPSPVSGGGGYLPVSNADLEKMIELNTQRFAERTAYVEELRLSVMKLHSIPHGAQAALAELNRELAVAAEADGDDVGAVRPVGWTDEEGRRILSEHGWDPEAVAEAAAIVAGRSASEIQKIVGFSITTEATSESPRR